MGSLDTTLSVKLDGLRNNNFVDVTTETIVETIWAITHFVYTGDNEVDFLRYSKKPPKVLGGAADHNHCHPSKDTGSIKIPSLSK